MTELQKGLANKFSMPTEEVFPQFVRLARTWQGFQEEMVVLSGLTAATQALHAFTECLRKIPLKELHAKFAQKRRRRGSQGAKPVAAEEKKVSQHDKYKLIL